MAIRVKYVERLFVENRPVIGWLPPPDIIANLLLVLRAAAAVADSMEPHSPLFANHECTVCDLRKALAAFDFSEEKP